LADVAAHFGDFGVDDESIAGGDLATEFDFVCAEEEADFSSVIGETHDENGSSLSHGFELKDAGHDGMAGEVATEEVLVHGNVLDSGALHVSTDGAGGFCEFR